MQHPCLPYAPFARQIPHYFSQTRIGLREVFLKEREAVVAVNERIGYKSLRMRRMVSMNSRARISSVLQSNASAEIGALGPPPPFGIVGSPPTCATRSRTDPLL